jgi:hypothetical protein
MSVVTNGWAHISNDSGSGDGHVTASVDTYYGRLDRMDDKIFKVNGQAGMRTITVTQDGHEFVEVSISHSAVMDWWSIDLSVIFYTNCKKFSIALSGQDQTEFEIGQVSIQEEGEVTPQVITPDGNGVYEPTGDPGRENRYMVIIYLTTKENYGETNKEVTVTLTGWSDDGGVYTYSDYKDIEQITR